MGIQMHIQTNACNVRRWVFFRKMFQEPQFATHSVPEHPRASLEKARLRWKLGSLPWAGAPCSAPAELSTAFLFRLRNWQISSSRLTCKYLRQEPEMEFFSPSNCYLMKCRAVLFFFQSCFWLEWLTAGGGGRKLGWWGFGEELGGFYCLKK